MSERERDGRRNPLARALRVLEHMLQMPHGDSGVRELAAELGWAPSTLHRILVLLEGEGLVACDRATGRYRIGPRLLTLALAVPPAFPLAREAVPLMQGLVDECDETALLGIYDPTRMEVAFAAAVESRQPVRYVADLTGRAGPLHAGASGLAILAFLAPHERERALAPARLVPVTERTVTDRRRLEGKLREIRRRGYARTAGQRVGGAVGIAAPILGAGGQPLGDIILTLPESRFERAREQPLAAAVMRCARGVSERVGAANPRHTIGVTP